MQIVTPEAKVIGWVLIGLGVALLAWGIRIDGNSLWRSDRSKIKAMWPQILVVVSLVGLAIGLWGWRQSLQSTVTAAENQAKPDLPRTSQPRALLEPPPVFDERSARHVSVPNPLAGTGRQELPLPKARSAAAPSQDTASQCPPDTGICMLGKNGELENVTANGFSRGVVDKGQNNHQVGTRVIAPRPAGDNLGSCRRPSQTGDEVMDQLCGPCASILCAQWGCQRMRGQLQIPPYSPTPHGCICPANAEQTCQGPLCPRKPVGATT